MRRLVIWVAPTERQLHQVLSGSGEPWKISSLPERHGCDVLIPTKHGIVGFQRKTLPDLVASLQDGRLYYELSQILCSATLRYSFLVVESDLSRTTDGSSYVEANLSVSSFRSILAKFYAAKTGYLQTSSPDDTVACCISVSRYIGTGRASVIHRPKQVTNEWGQITSKSYGVFLLQSFPGIGPKVAAAIYDHFEGVPLQWTVDPSDLARVPGIGRRRAEALMASLRPAAGS